MTVRKVDGPCDKMDSAEDAYKQCEAGPSNRHLRKEQFCEQLFALEHLGTSGVVVCLTHTRRFLTAFLSLKCLHAQEVDSALLLERAPMCMSKLSSEPSHYAIPKTDEEIKRAREESIPKATRSNTAFLHLDCGMTGLRIVANALRKWFHHSTNFMIKVFSTGWFDSY